MTKLLFIEASPRGAASTSAELANTYLAALRSQNPGLEVDHLNLWNVSLPAFDGDKVAAKVNVIFGHAQNTATKTAWDEIVDHCARFTSANRYLLAVPMWNGGVPYRLKHYIDIVQQPQLMFDLIPGRGYVGLLKDKHATLVLTAGAFSTSAPSPAFGVDYQSTYLRFWLNQAGITEIDEVRFQPTLLTDDYNAGLDDAKQHAITLAAKHGRLRRGP